MKLLVKFYNNVKKNLWLSFCEALQWWNFWWNSIMIAILFLQTLPSSNVKYFFAIHFAYLKFVFNFPSYNLSQLEVFPCYIIVKLLVFSIITIILQNCFMFFLWSSITSMVLWRSIVSSWLVKLNLKLIYNKNLLWRSTTSNRWQFMTNSHLFLVFMYL
jgi:hypothetical protein